MTARKATRRPRIVRGLEIPPDLVDLHEVISEAVKDPEIRDLLERLESIVERKELEGEETSRLEDDPEIRVLLDRLRKRAKPAKEKRESGQQ